MSRVFTYANYQPAFLNFQNKHCDLYLADLSVFVLQFSRICDSSTFSFIRLLGSDVRRSLAFVSTVIALDPTLELSDPEIIPTLSVFSRA